MSSERAYVSLDEHGNPVETVHQAKSRLEWMKHLSNLAEQGETPENLQLIAKRQGIPDLTEAVCRCCEDDDPCKALAEERGRCEQALEECADKWHKRYKAEDTERAAAQRKEAEQRRAREIAAHDAEAERKIKAAKAAKNSSG